MLRLAFIQDIISKNNYKNYLEIGIFQWDVFDHIVCEKKTGVDPDLSHYKGPNKALIHEYTSNQYFFKPNHLHDEEKFDCVFIDGLHLREQVVKDVENVLPFLNEWGTIILHDTNPPRKDWCQREWLSNWWTGDVYKAVIHFRMRDDLTVETYQIETGITTIQKIPSPNPLWYEFLDSNREYLLNIL